MRAVLLGCWLVLVANDSFAHRLDEYLQATRIAVASNRIDLTFELTPGVAVAHQIIERIDRDHDGRVSADEGEVYARQFLKDLTVAVDGKAVQFQVTAVSVPELLEMRSGTGVIRICATSSVGLLASGAHTLNLTNGHLPAISVYLVNALQSQDRAVEIGRQSRDELQKKYELRFWVRQK